jgi:hypothetical protein
MYAHGRYKVWAVSDQTGGTGCYAAGGAIRQGRPLRSRVGCLRATWPSGKKRDNHLLHLLTSHSPLSPAHSTHPCHQERMLPLHALSFVLSLLPILLPPLPLLILPLLLPLFPVAAPPLLRRRR